MIARVKSRDFKGGAINRKLLERRQKDADEPLTSAAAIVAHRFLLDRLRAQKLVKTFSPFHHLLSARTLFSTRTEMNFLFINLNYRKRATQLALLNTMYCF